MIGLYFTRPMVCALPSTLAYIHVSCLPNCSYGRALLHCSRTTAGVEMVELKFTTIIIYYDRERREYMRQHGLMRIDLQGNLQICTLWIECRTVREEGSRSCCRIEERWARRQVRSSAWCSENKIHRTFSAY